MRISINTDHLQTAAKASNEAAMSLQQANAILSAITTHQDWVCPNKTVINQLIEGNRQRISRLLADATSFDQAVLEVTEQFLQAEASIDRRLDTLDGLLSQINAANAIEAGTLSTVASNFIPAAGQAVSSLLQVEERRGEDK